MRYISFMPVIFLLFGCGSQSQYMEKINQANTKCLSELKRFHSLEEIDDIKSNISHATYEISGEELAVIYSHGKSPVFSEEVSGEYKTIVYCSIGYVNSSDVDYMSVFSSGRSKVVIDQEPVGGEKTSESKTDKSIFYQFYFSPAGIQGDPQIKIGS